MEALKEWATVVRALEDGKQVLLLRKGGILETASGFNLEARKFFLFPTFEHQEEKHLKAKFQNYLNEVKNYEKSNGFIPISSYAEIVEEKDISDVNKIRNLSHLHILSDSYVEERINWLPDRPMKVIFLRVFKIPQLSIAVKKEFQGCKSWIEINEEIPSGNPALDDSEFELQLEKFRSIIK